MKRPEVLAEMARKMRKRTAKQRDCQISAIRRRVITEYWQSLRKPMSQA